MTTYALVGPNGVDRIAAPGTIDPNVATKAGWSWLEVVDIDRPAQGELDVIEPSVTVENGKVVRGWAVTQRALTTDDVNAERNRRLRSFVFGGKAYDFDANSQLNIAGAGILAFAAIINGAQPGDLRWANAAKDFSWVAADNTSVTMDAQTTFAFAQAAGRWKADHIHAGRIIKDLGSIPADYAADARWPA